MRKFERYEHNPSIEVIGRLLWDGKEFVRTLESKPGIYKGLSTEIQIQKVAKTIKDKSPFLKLYIDTNALDEFIELSATSQRLLTHIIKKLQFAVSYIYLDSGIVMRDMEICRSSYSKGLDELLERQWIFRSTETNKYFINLILISYGNREDIYLKEYKAFM
jgi:uncharacterized protein (DUF952 family)